MKTSIIRRVVAMTVMTVMLSFVATPAVNVQAMSGDTTVYITKTGECYHADGCSSLRRSKYATTLSSAIANGYVPCSKCNPGGLDTVPAPATAQTQAIAPAPATPVTTAAVPATQNTTTGWDCIYNEVYYRTNNPDVDKAFPGDSAGIFQHFKTSGMSEGRKSCSEFDVTNYRANNADLNEAFGDDLAKYYYHYMNTGKAEGRSGK